jgi:MFS family permease
VAQRLQRLLKTYPRQFWLLFWGLLISTIGTSMIWPFLMIYVSERLNLPLTLVASLMTLNAGMGLLSSFFAGPIIDRAGRKWVMAISLFATGLVYLGLSRADSLPAFAVLMAISGAFNPLYRVGADAMMADLIPAERRADAYSLLRTSNNLGVALGPALGGFIATISYAIAFYFAASGLVIYGLLVTFLAIETLPVRPMDDVRTGEMVKERYGGYGRVLADRQFISFVGSYTLTQMCAAMIWVLLAVYAKENYAVSESLYGFIPMTNALMVVFFQYSVTQVTKRRQPLSTLAVGALFYSVALGSVALGSSFWGFWLSMVILTVGELIQSPTATTLAANLAPAEMRGRYMSLYGLTWGVASGVGPVLGGLLNDQLGPKAIWYGGAAIGLASSLLFLGLVQRYERRAAYAR